MVSYHWNGPFEEDPTAAIDIDGHLAVRGTSLENDSEFDQKGVREWDVNYPVKKASL